MKSLSEMTAFTRGIARLLISTLHFIRRACVGVGVVDVLATWAEPDSEDDAVDATLRVGVLNYRTGHLDDGTDPYGWYERD